MLQLSDFFVSDTHQSFLTFLSDTSPCFLTFLCPTPSKVRMFDGATGDEKGLLGDKYNGAPLTGPIHAKHVNALAVDRRMGRLYTGDGDGVIW